MESTLPSSGTHKAATAMFGLSMQRDPAIYNTLGNTRNLIQVRDDFASIVHTGIIENRKQKSHGKSHVADDVLGKVVDVIVSSCSSVA